MVLALAVVCAAASLGLSAVEPAAGKAGGAQAQASPGHPFLFFRPADIPLLRERASTTHRQYLEDLEAWAAEFMKYDPIEAAALPDNRDTLQVYYENAAPYIINMSLLYTLTGDEKYAQAARKWLMTLCTYPTETNGGYFIGAYTVAMAAGYDMLYGYLAQDERDAVRQHIAGLVARGIQGTRTDWWAGISLHHDHWLPVTGLCVGAVSISGEVPDAAAWLDYLMGVFKADLSAVGDDGSWTEGTADWVYAMNMTYMLCDAYRSLTGVNMFDLPFIRNGSMYRLYNWLPNDTYVYHHDSHPDGRYNVMGFASCHLLRKLAAELQDGRAQWLAEREEQRDLDRGRAVTPREDWMVNKSHTVPAHQCVAWNFLWYDPAVRPQPPEGLPLHRCFPNQGLVILRSGWGPEDVVFSFTCAPAGGHAGRAAVLAGDERMGNGITHVHARANSFDLFVNGNYLAIPPGYGERPSTSENTLTIEGAAQRLNPRYAAALVRQDFQGGYCYFAGDATDCYPEEIGLKRWLRHVAYLPPDVFLICDELAAAASVASGKATRWQLDFNPDLNDAQIDQARQTVTILSQASPAEKGAMTVAFLHPQGLAIEKAVLRNPQRGYVRFGQVTAQLQDIFGSSQNPQILAVLFPLKNASASPPAVRAVKGDALLGAVVDRKDESQCALFCLGDARSAEARRLQAKLLGKPKLTCYLFGLEPNEGYDVSCVAGAGGDGLAAYDLLVRKGGRVIANDAGSVCVRSASAIASGPAAARAE